MYGNLFLPVQNLRRTVINPFGLCWILFFRHRDVASWPAINPLTGVIDASLVFKDGATFYAAQFIEKDRLFTEGQKDSGAGEFVETTVQGIIGGNNLGHIVTTAAMMGERFGVLLQERNGEKRLVGGPDAGAKFIWDYTSGVESQSRKRNCKWVFESQFPVPIYEGAGIVIDDEIIQVGGGITTPAGTPGSLELFTTFVVGEPGAPMMAGDEVFTHPGLADKKVIVFADGIKLATKATPNKRTITKVQNETSIHFVGGTAGDETIDIYTF